MANRAAEKNGSSGLEKSAGTVRTGELVQYVTVTLPVPLANFILEICKRVDPTGLMNPTQEIGRIFAEAARAQGLVPPAEEKDD